MFSAAVAEKKSRSLLVDNHVLVTSESIKSNTHTHTRIVYLIDKYNQEDEGHILISLK